MIQNVFKKKNLALLTMATVLTFGSLSVTGDSIAMAATAPTIAPPQVPAGVGVVESNLDEPTAEIEVEMEKEQSKTSAGAKQTGVVESKEQPKVDKPAPQIIKELEPNHELVLGGHEWNVLNPQDGFIIMLESVEDLKLDFEYKEGDYNKILEYFDNEFMATLSEDEKGLLAKDQFGLTIFNSKLYVTANLNPDAKPLEMKLESKADKGADSKKEDKAESKEKEGSMAWLYVLIALILIVVVGIFVKYVQEKDAEKEKQEKDKK